VQYEIDIIQIQYQLQEQHVQTILIMQVEIILIQVIEIELIVVLLHTQHCVELIYMRQVIEFVVQ
jgi:hypothetical protein